jgi:V/A-type H+-transporting ATPase subunit I
VRWRETIAPSRMARVAIVAPADHLREVLVVIADSGTTEIDEIRDVAPSPAGEALRRALAQPAFAPQTSEPVLLLVPTDLKALETAGRLRELAGEAEIDRVRAQAITQDRVSALTGWCPQSALRSLSIRLSAHGGAVAVLRIQAGSIVPTMIEDRGAAGAFQPLVDAYTTVPYQDVNPSLLAGIAYSAMFGMMFGDVGHGLMLLIAGLVLRAGWLRRLGGLVRFAPFVTAAGLTSTGFGFAYGEMFGPTGIVPALWLRPLDHPTTLLLAGIAVGGVLLGVSYAMGSVNRWREGGPAAAALALSGLAGAAIYIGLGMTALGWRVHNLALEVTGITLGVGGLGAGFAGCFAEAGGHSIGAMQAAIEMFDATVRIGSNVVSFARLAAFGMTHAALGYIVWRGTAALWGRGPYLWIGAALLFVVGNAVAFALEGLVAAVQALRLEYYEMFSRIFVREGRRFKPWQVPTATTEEV